MTWLGLVLGGIGIVDLVRPHKMRFDLQSTTACLLPGAVTVGVLWLGAVPLWVTVGTGAGILLVGIGWAAVATWSLREGRPAWPALVAGIAILSGTLLASPYSPHMGGRLQHWYSKVPLGVMSGTPLDRFVAVVGCALFLVSSGNVIVRLVLAAAGNSVARNEQQIKGGRVLGPMERLLILGLGLAGNLEAAAIIVAAKGLLRFPELQAYRADVGTRETLGMRGQRVDALTEYFLIGSMASWMLALAWLGLIS
jgi:hypothetical protein